MDSSMPTDDAKAASKHDNATPKSSSAPPDTTPSRAAVQEPYSFPSVNLPKSGGAIKGIGEKFSVSPANGTSSFSVPIKTSKGRGDSTIELSLSYSSGAGNGPFGIGWQISSQAITRKTDKGLPQYLDTENSDVFLLSGMEDLVPVQQLKSDGTFVNKIEFRVQHGKTFRVARYNPRIESGFLRILRLTDTETHDAYWEVKTDSNITTIFGDSQNSRVFDPSDPGRVFEWLPSKTYDDKGNITLYEYKEEDSSGVDLNSLPELQRSTLSRTAARYIKRIKYGNTVSALSPTFKASNSWMFEIVFDYGDHDIQYPRSETSQPWPVRSDPFSSRRSCFEIRMYRLCRRILMFHHFPDELSVGKDCVVASFNMNFETVNMDRSSGYSITTVLKSVTQEHWRRAKGDDYEKEHLPPLEFAYSMAQPSKQSKVLKSSSLGNLPAGLTGDYQLVDLEGQGLAGVVLRTEGSLQYMANLANGEFGPTETISTNPSAVFKKGSEQWMDLCGGGKIELVQLSGSAPGFYERDLEETGGWNTFRTFKSYPNVAWDNKQLKFLDLTGNGIADAVIIDDYELRIYPGLGNDGFGSPWYASPPTEDGPGSRARLLFWDGTEALYTSDMTGDGLADLVRVRYSEVCYWPNLGYGKFDRKVIMDGTPIFDSEELFDQKYLRLADIDGSGTTDIVYLGNRVTMYQNLSGNALSKGIEVPGFPGIDVSTNVQVTDLLGRGTACLVWSSNLASDYGRQIRYLDLMEAGKPYLLVSMDNNMGWETRLTYEASTQFYARDKKLGRPWTSLLPFPVQCVSKTEVVDRVSRNLFTTTYAYHDGFFDGVEREFRGFGMVETLDTEKYSSLESCEGSFDNINKHTNVPPTLTKTWYHTGEYRDGAAVATYPDVPYWAEDKSQKAFRSLSETTLPSSIVTLSGTTSYLPDAQERREACRALRGNMLRSEIYAIDGSDLQTIPYLIKESNMHVEQRQRLGSNCHAVFFVRPKESLEMVYDRKQYRHGTMKYFDPRVSHTLTLETDYYGNPLKAMTVSYGRERDDPDARLDDEDRKSQKKSYAVLSRTTTTNSLDQTETYLLPKPAESQSYEIINIDICRRRHGGQNGRLGLVSFAEASRAVSLLATGTFDIPFENFSGPYPSQQHLYRRLLKESIAFYRRDDFNGPLPLGVIEPLGLPWKTFQLALSDSQAEQYSRAGKISSEDLNTILQSDCDYFRVQKRSGWWISSGEAFFSHDRESTAKEELREAREHFFVIRRSRPPWDRPEKPAESFYTFDKYDLLIQEARDAYDNRVTVGERAVDPSLPLIKMGNDYRLLRPFLVMDANRNHSEVLFDVLGNVIAAAAMGKPEENVGDSLEDVQRSLSDQEMRDFFQSPITLSKQLLGSATSRTIFDFFSYYRTRHDKHPQPNWVSSLSRETHVSDLAEGASSRVFVTMTYSDGSGRSIQTKAQCEPGPLLGPGCCEDVNEDAEAGTKDKEDYRWASTRWLVSSWVILNNKNKPVKQYEPFFSKTHAFQDLAIHGVSSTTLYDAVGRTVAVLSPDHTWTKVRFGPWSSDKWDKNDTVLIRDPSQDADVGPFFALLPREDYMPTWYQERAHGQMGAIQQEAAQKSAAAANTPTTVLFDSLGRVCLSLEVLRNPLRAASSGTILRQPSYIDVQGLPYKVTDTLGRLTSTSIYSIGGTVLSETNFDNGTKWVLVDSSGKSILTWNARQQRFKTEYDRNRRVIGLHLKEGDKEYLVEKSTYGETEPDPEKHNARGRIIRTYDQSGITKTPDYDFQGNIILSDRQLVSDYKNIIDWHCEDAVLLETETFVEQILFDALSKPIQTVLPDGTITFYHYNDRALINSVTTTVPNSEFTSEAIQDIEYDAKGRRTKVVNGNGVQTVTSFDPLTFRICRIESFRERTSLSPSTSSSDDNPQRRLKPRNKRRSTKRYQDLRYTYDASGNITHVADKASKTVFFRNQRAEASQSFTYDSLYRLIEATGREHLGQMHAAKAKHYPGQNQPTAGDSIYHPNDGQALGRYVERYVYDAVNNLQKMHHSNLTENANWTRHYHYEEPSLVDNKQVNNRLSYTKIGSTIERYRYDRSEKESGSMTSMPGLPHLSYDYGEHMVSSVQSVGSEGAAKEKTYYKYDGTGKRVRKITERHSTSDKASIIKETIYIGGAFEVFRRYTAAAKSLEVNNIRIMESGRQLLLIENRVEGGDDRLPGLLYRYQLANFQGSAQIELDQEGKLISYEEYTPYGVSSVKANFEQTEIPKRYRFLGKERDVETGLYHLGARYYAPWLGRFVSADPKGSVDGSNLYQYSHGNPVMLADPGGTAAAPATGAPPPSAALGWTSDVIRSRARDWIVFENLPSWVSGLREWRVFGRMAAGDFAAMLQNRMIAGGVKAADVAAKFEQYLPNAATGKRLGSSFIDFMFPALKQAYEHKLMDFTKYSEDGVLAVSELRSAFGGADGIIAQLEKHTANIAAKFGTGWETRLAVTIRGVEHGSPGWTAMTTEINDIMARAGQLAPMIEHANNPAIMAAREGLDSAAMAFIAKAGGLAKFVGAGAEVLGPLAVGVGVLMMPSQARAATNSAEKPSTRTQAALDLGSGVTSVGVAVVAAKATAITAAAGTTGAAVAAGVVVAGAAVGGAAVGALAGGYVADKVEHSEFAQEHLGETGAALAGYGTGVLAGAAAGALVGAAVGSVLPVVGTAAGAVIGGAAGALGAEAKILISKYWS